MKYVYVDYIGKYGLHYYTAYRIDNPNGIGEFFKECAMYGYTIENVRVTDNCILSGDC